MVRRSRPPVEETAAQRGVDGAVFGCGLVGLAGLAGMLTIVLAHGLLGRLQASRGGEASNWVAFALLLVAGLPIGALVGALTMKPAIDGAIRASVVVGAALCAGGATGATPIDLLLPRPLAVMGAITMTAALAGAGVLGRRKSPP